jgi:hypothetical protein
MIALAVALARAWVHVYTRGMPADLRDGRRAEIESDLWEQCHDEAPRRRGGGLDILGRTLRGVPSDLSWRLQHRARGRLARRLRLGVVAARRHRWTVFPALVEVSYLTGAAGIATPSFVDAPEQLVMALGAAAILCGMLLLWRGTAPPAAAWLVCAGALAPTLMLFRHVPASLLWAALAALSAVRRSDALRRLREST